MELQTQLRNHFQAWGRIVYRFAWWVILASVLLTAGLAFYLPSIAFENNTSDFLLEDDPEFIRYNTFREQFGLDDQIMLAIEPAEVFDLEFLDTLRDLHATLEAELPHVAEVTSLINARQTRGEADTLIVEDLLEDWPESEADLSALRTRVFANPLYLDQMISRDGKLTTLIIRPATYSSAGSEAEALDSFDDDESLPDAASAEFLSSQEKDAIVTALDRILPAYRSDTLQIHVAAGAVTGARITQMLNKEVRRYTSFSTLTIALLLIGLFRRLSGLVLPMVVVACSLISTLGLMPVLDIPFSMVLQMVPIFVMTVGVCASVHVLVLIFQKMDRGIGKEEAIAYAFHHSGLAIFMTSLTTAAGMLSFQTAEIQPIQNLGIVAPIGVLMTFIYSMSLLPALVTVLPIRPRNLTADASRPDAPPGRLARGLGWVGDSCTRHPWLILGAAALLTGASFIGIANTRFAQDPLRWFPDGHEIIVATDLLDERLGGSATVEFMLDTGKENGLHDPAVLRKIEEAMRFAGRVRHDDIFVGKSISLTDILKETNQALHANDPAAYAIPEDRNLIAQEFLLFENSGSDDLEQFVDSQFRKGRISLRIPFADGTVYPPFLAELQNGFGEIFGDGVTLSMTGIAPVSARVNVAMVTSMARSYLLALSLITPLMIFLIGNWRLGWVSMIPNLFPIIVILGVMGWLDIPLDPSNIIIGSLLIGLAVDDTIHFMQTFQQYHRETGDTAGSVRSTLMTTGSALLFTSIVLASAFFIMAALSIMKNTMTFGYLTAFGIAAAFVADIMISPALMAVIVKDRTTDEANKRSS